MAVHMERRAARPKAAQPGGITAKSENMTFSSNGQQNFCDSRIANASVRTFQAKKNITMQY